MDSRTLNYQLSNQKTKCDNQATEITSLKANLEAASDEASGAFTPVSEPTTREDPKPSAHQSGKGNFSMPDALLIGNSLMDKINPALVLAPKFTKIHKLEKKNLDGALEYLSSDSVKDIKPKTVILHCLENNISKESGPVVLNKLKKVVSKHNSVFPGTPLAVVEPIGRGKNEEQYNEVATYVRENLHTVVDRDMIIRTENLQTVDRKLFSADLVHLRPAGRSQLCVAYKKHMYPLLGMEYTEPSKRESGATRPPSVMNRSRDRSFTAPKRDSNQSYNYRGGHQRRNQPTQEHDRLAHLITALIKQIK